MRYKLICAAAMIGAVLSAALLTQLQSGLVATRTHQHLEAVPKQASAKDGTEFTTHLPIISLTVDETQLGFSRQSYENGYQYIVKETVPCSVAVIDNERENNHPSDAPVLTTPANIRYRGASSIYHDKHNYKITFLHADGTENKDLPLLGMEPYDEWALHGPFLDRSLMRNYMCMNIAGQIMPGTPDVRFCELFINGDYRGVYVAMETVARARGRVEIDPYTEGNATTSYIIRQDRYTETPTNLNVFGSYTFRIDALTPLEVIYPGERLTKELHTYIERDFSAFEKALYSFDYDDVTLGYRHYIDVSSFIDFAIINEFFQNYDAGYLSTYYYRDTRGKIYAGPVWDFNNSLDNFDKPVRDEEGIMMLFAPHYEQLIKDEYFVDALIRRYRQLRETVLSEAYLLDYIDDTAAFLGDAADRNFTVWNYTLSPDTIPRMIELDPADRNPQSFAEAVQNLKDFIVWRGAWLDEHIDVLWQYCHESAVKKYNA